MNLPVCVWEVLQRQLEDVGWVDASGLVEEARRVKSPAEIACIRRAAALSDLAMRPGSRPPAWA
jgi:Xaa-Pro aminopeptidase